MKGKSTTLPMPSPSGPLTRTLASRIAKAIAVDANRAESANHTNAASLGERILAWRARGGWKALGHASFSAAVASGVLGHSRSFVFYCLAAHQQPAEHKAKAKAQNLLRMSLTGQGAGALRNLLRFSHRAAPNLGPNDLALRLGEFVAAREKEWLAFLSGGTAPKKARLAMHAAAA